MKNLKLNIHINNDCNYCCKHCFSKFNKCKEISANEWEIIINNISKYLNITQINIAGGEPLLYKELKPLLEKLKKYSLSIITNGSLIDDDFIDNYLDYFDMIGISIDSFDHNTNRKIGRINNNKTIDINRLKEIISKIRNKNRLIEIKINTTVTKYNKNENIWEHIKELDINKWKILKSKRHKQESYDNKNHIINNQEFNVFLEQNINIQIKDFQNSMILNKDNKVIVIEPSLKNSYLLVDPEGYLIVNSDEGHVDRINCRYTLDINKIEFDVKKYESRYNNKSSK